MIAEIYGKIENNKEDELTGNFFGTLRYTGFEKILQPLLIKCIRPDELADKLKNIRGGYWADKIYFWHYDSPAEIDVLLDFEEILIGIEVKYQSGLSGDDQLEREAKILKRKANGREKILILIAPESKCHEIVTKTRCRNIFNEFGVNLSYISWEDVSDELTKLSLKENFDVLIAEDLINLLWLKGFESFRSFDVSVELDDFLKDFFTSDEEVNNLTGKEHDKIIKKAFDTAVETHKKVYQFIKLCRSLCKESDSNYEPLIFSGSQYFLHWLSDDDSEPIKWPDWLSWSTKFFVLPFRLKDNENGKSVYVMEINLFYPRITVARFVYKDEMNYSKIKISNRNSKDFDEYSLLIDNVDDPPINEFIKVKSPKNYSKLSYAWFVAFPLSDINGNNVKEKIFGTFDKLAELKD